MVGTRIWVGTVSARDGVVLHHSTFWKFRPLLALVPLVLGLYGHGAFFALKIKQQQQPAKRGVRAAQ